VDQDIPDTWFDEEEEEEKEIFRVED